MRNRGIRLGLLGGAALVGAARRVASAPPDPALAARAHMVAHSGPWRHGYASVNGVRVHYAEMGEGPLVVLLHGFPQCWYTWHDLMPRLATRFHVVAPDMRGYNESDKPDGVAAYSTAEVARDIAGLIEALGEEQAYVVGHDWGGSVAWRTAMDHPHRVFRLCVINAPHPAAFAREVRHREQLVRSLYALYFQLPLLPEATVRLGIRRVLTGSAFVPSSFTDDALDMYENGISQPGAATAMLNYYRATMREALADPNQSYATILTPTLHIWGIKDLALSPRLTEGLEEWVPNIRIERVEDSGHWVPEEKPALVADLLGEFFS